VIALVLGLLVGLVACTEPKDEPASSETTVEVTEETTTETTNEPQAEPEATVAPGEIAVRFQPLLDHKGALPDEELIAFMLWLMPVCCNVSADAETNGFENLQTYPYLRLLEGWDGPSYFAPDYAAISSALDGKLSPGMYHWLAMQEADAMISEYDYSGLSDLGQAKDCYEFETQYPDLIAALLKATYTIYEIEISLGYYSTSSYHMEWGYLYVLDTRALMEEYKDKMLAERKIGTEAFLNDQANKKYPFYDAVRADYQNRYDINS